VTFTYNGTLTTDLDDIRFKVRDTTENSGPRPSGGNFTDEEINGLLAIEGTAERTVAALYEALASEWSVYVDTKIGPRDEKLSQVAGAYERLARRFRKDYGYGSNILTTGFVTRVDGYSDDIDSGAP
jgi:hypothetical protein